MASLLEPPPLAAVAAIVGFTALSLALGMTGGRREAVAEASGDSALPDTDDTGEGRTPKSSPGSPPCPAPTPSRMETDDEAGRQR